jgi:hypothetical protein
MLSLTAFVAEVLKKIFDESLHRLVSGKLTLRGFGRSHPLAGATHLVNQFHETLKFLRSLVWCQPEVRDQQRPIDVFLESFDYRIINIRGRQFGKFARRSFEPQSLAWTIM